MDPATAPPTAPSTAPATAEVLVRLGTTLLVSRDLTSAASDDPWTGLLRIGGAALAALGLGLGVVGGAPGPALASTITGAALIAAGVAARSPGGRDRFVVGEAPGVDLPLAVEPGEDAHLGALELVRVAGDAVVLRLPAGFDGEICPAEPNDGEGPARESIAELRARGWRTYRLGVGARAILRRGDLTIEIRARAAASLPALVLPREGVDRRYLGAQLTSLAVLGALFVVAGTRERVAEIAEPPPERFVRALASLPTPPERPTQSPPPEPLPPALDRSRARGPARPAADDQPTELAERPQVIVDGQAIAAPKGAAVIPKMRRSANVGVIYADQRYDILGQAAAEFTALLDEHIGDKFSDTEEDRAMWIAQRDAAPIMRGFGGLELVGTGRTGGGEAEEVVDLKAEDQRPTLLAANTRRRAPEAALGERSSAAAGPSRGILRLGAPRVEGELSLDQVVSVAKAHRVQIHRCWIDAERRGTTRGKIDLEISVNRQGKVRRAEVFGALDPRLESCIRSAAKGWRFDELPGASPATVVLPYDYDPA